MTTVGNPPAILAQAKERAAQRLMMAYACRLVLCSCRNVSWRLDLLSISAQHSRATISASWIQAHGHAQIFGWIGTFIVGIGFYSLPKMAGKGAYSGRSGWVALLLWAPAVLMRWSAGVYQWHWQFLLPLSAGLELAAFLVFFFATRNAHRSSRKSSGGRMPAWVQSVLLGTFFFVIALLLNLAAALHSALAAGKPVFPPGLETRLLALLCYGFIVPTIWGFSARWLPVFLGLRQVNERWFRAALALDILGVLSAQTGLFAASAWLVAAAAIVSIAAFSIFPRPARPSEDRWSAFFLPCLCSHGLWLVYCGHGDRDCGCYP